MAKHTMWAPSKNSQGNIVPPEPTYPAIASPEYSNPVKALEDDLKSNLVKIIEAFKKEMNESLNEIEYNTIKQVKEMNKTV